MTNDLYHPRYPSTDADYYERRLWFAAVLLCAKELGINPYLLCNKEHREAVEKILGKPGFETVSM